MGTALLPGISSLAPESGPPPPPPRRSPHPRLGHCLCQALLTRGRRNSARLSFLLQPSPEQLLRPSPRPTEQLPEQAGNAALRLRQASPQLDPGGWRFPETIKGKPVAPEPTSHRDPRPDQRGRGGRVSAFGTLGDSQPGVPAGQVSKGSLLRGVLRFVLQAPGDE